MKAVVRRGKQRGKKIKVMQWCNDWFLTDDGIYSPYSLAFNLEGMQKILESKTNGILLDKFETYSISGFDDYMFSFKPNRNRYVSDI